MSASFDLDEVDRFYAGTVGRPGQRVFYIQAVQGDTLVSLKCEKLHVSALAASLEKMLRDLPPQTEATTGAPSLVMPVLAEFIVGSIGLGYEASSDRIVVVFEEAETADDGDGGGRGGDEDDKARARLWITRAQAAAFVQHGADLVRSGRPTCGRCATPIDPDGYLCHCWN